MHKVVFVDGLSNDIGLGSGGIALAEQHIMNALTKAQKATRVTGRVLLILDGVDFLRAAMGCGVMELLQMVGELQSVSPSIDCDQIHRLTLHGF